MRAPERGRDRLHVYSQCADSRSPKTRKTRLSVPKACASVFLAIVLGTGAVPVDAWAQAATAASQDGAVLAATADTSWYRDSETTFELTNVSQLAGLGQLVEQGNDFTGKTVLLARDINGANRALAPIGSEEHRFNGTFDGQNHTIDNLSIEVSRGHDVGLFGNAGKDSLIRNVALGSFTSLSYSISEEDGIYLSDMGLIVGYSEGSIAQCSVAGTLTLVSAVKQKSEDSPYVMSRIGGVAGVCYGDVTDCTFSGKLDLTASSDPVSAYDEASLIAYVGGIVGYQGDYTQSAKESTASSHGSITGCVNEGVSQGISIKIETPSMAGTDRFGKAVSAQSSYVGGITGYARGSVSDCTNYGYLRVPNAEIVGGIVGSFRSVESTSNGNYSGDGGDEGSPNDPIVCSQCVNIGIVYARAAVGGIIGQAGTYTTITGCMNGRTKGVRETLVVGTRWNKPFVAGIVGRTYGDVSFCGNLGIVASATWDNEAARTLKGAQGYYSSGVAGGILHYTKTDKTSGTQERISPLPTVYDSYHAGSIETQSGFRARHVVGNNEGYVYDNTALDGACPDNLMTFGEVPTDDDASGTASNNLICCDKKDGGQVVQKAADSLKGNGIMHYKYRTTKENADKTIEEVFVEGDKDSVFEHLNSMAPANDWQVYWQASDGSVNGGFPVLSWQAEGFDRTDLSGAVLTLKENAKYTGGEAVPSVSATMGGTTLLQNVDFKVVPQTGAVDRTAGKPYAATIEGIGKYKGISTSSVNYGIDKGDLSQCNAIIDTKVFNWEPQEPSQVTVRNALGDELDASEFTWTMPQGEVANAGIYDVSITATEASNYEGTLIGSFLIAKAKFKSTFSIDGSASISYLGTDYEWYSASNSISDPDSAKIPVFDYTGYPIKPTVKNVTYLGRALTEGKDYVVLYGDLGADDSGDDVNLTVSKENRGEAGKTAYGAVMVRYSAGSNFSNYENMLFKIADTGEKITLSSDNIVVPANGVPYENHPMCPVSVSYGGNVLQQGVDYAITYANNNAVGTASYTVVGMGRFDGEVSGTFQITDEPAFTYTWEIVEADGAQVAKITGFTYNGTSEDLLDLVIPSQVEQNGKTYPVAIIGENAFGGANRASFDGTCKLQIGTVVVPASVTTLEKRAFGGSAQYKPSVKEVRFAEGSQLKVIGDNAFEYCLGLSEMRIPAGVETIGAKAFSQCSNLTTLFFETVSASLPSSVAKDSFSSVGGSQTTIRVIGTSNRVSAVKQLAANNAASVGSTANGGHSFTFAVYAGDLSQAQIAPIEDQVLKEHSGAVLTPEVKVTLNGKTLVAGQDFAVSYANNNVPGTASVAISGLGGYIGSASTMFTIVGKHAAVVDRVAGATAVGTAAEIAKVSWPEGETSEWAVIARSDDFADAMSSTGLAGALNAPIVLTSRDGLSDEAAATLERLGVKNAYVIGGTAAVSPSVESSLSAMGVSSARIAGDSRDITSVKCAEKIAELGGSSYAIVARPDSFRDALSMSSFAYKYHVPILLESMGASADEREVPAAARAMLTGDGAFASAEVFVPGGTAAVSEASLTFLGRSHTRLWGNTGYSTSLAIANYLTDRNLLSSDVVCVATGAMRSRGVDALAGAALAGRAGGVMLLVSAQPDYEVEDYTASDGYLSAHAAEVDQVYVLGGTTPMPDSVMSRIESTW